jgi:hypothetical protein
MPRVYLQDEHNDDSTYDHNQECKDKVPEQDMLHDKPIDIFYRTDQLFRIHFVKRILVKRQNKYKIIL